MSNVYEQKVNDFMAKVIAKNPAEVEFHQAVHEVVETIIPFIEENPKQRSSIALLSRNAPLYFVFRG